ncbi:Maintenance of telomere capping protein 1 [Choanephora cucurbitarum]|uniref:Maintenance of telomere capping protein 1 n=1 Tax=Choanephora cucurbitarum TaxID=101091 RepID=A0A1C7NN22_9FUNG|nr:Maintenance of telomere capping protein 1 [Choanephora cucurbitarum]
MATAKDETSLSEAEKFLESLNLPDAQVAGEETENKTDPNDIMSFLDEISNYPPTEEKEQEKPTEKPTEQPKATTESQSWTSWGNSFWNQASAAVKTTTDQLNRSVVNTDTATKLLESRVKTLQNLKTLKSTGLKQLTTTFLETVAPPISEHELVEVYLTYEMEGYTGLEALVYRAFARVMEHTESGQVTVHQTVKQESEQRQLKMSKSVKEGLEAAEASLTKLMQQPVKESNEVYLPQTGATPIIQSPIYMALQAAEMSITEDPKDAQLIFVLVIMDPKHQLKFKTYSQSIPLNWLDIPLEENEWVDDKMIEILRMAVTTIAQDYVYTRMSGSSSSDE